MCFSLAAHAETARLADRLGFAALWVRDVPLYDPVEFGDAGSVFEIFTHLGYLAAVTRRIVLGTAAVVLPLRKPLLVAKAAATVDHLSGSRFVLGLAGGDRLVVAGQDLDWLGAHVDGWFNYPRGLASRRLACPHPCARYAEAVPDTHAAGPHRGPQTPRAAGRPQGL